MPGFGRGFHELHTQCTIVGCAFYKKFREFGGELHAGELIRVLEDFLSSVLRDMEHVGSVHLGRPEPADASMPAMSRTPSRAIAGGFLQVL